MGTAVFEETVAAALVQVDEQRGDGTAYVSLLHCANDEETLERLLGKAMEYVARVWLCAHHRTDGAAALAGKMVCCRTTFT